MAEFPSHHSKQGLINSRAPNGKRVQPIFFFFPFAEYEFLSGSVRQAGTPRVPAVHCERERGSPMAAMGLSKNMAAPEKEVEF